MTEMVNMRPVIQTRIIGEDAPVRPHVRLASRYEIQRLFEVDEDPEVNRWMEGKPLNRKLGRVAEEFADPDSPIYVITSGDPKNKREFGRLHAYVAIYPPDEEYLAVARDEISREISQPMSQESSFMKWLGKGMTERFTVQEISFVNWLGVLKRLKGEEAVRKVAGSPEDPQRSLVASGVRQMCIEYLRHKVDRDLAAHPDFPGMYEDTKPNTIFMAWANTENEKSIKVLTQACFRPVGSAREFTDAEGNTSVEQLYVLDWEELDKFLKQQTRTARPLFPGTDIKIGEDANRSGTLT